MVRPIDNRELNKLKKFIYEELEVSPRIRTVPMKHNLGLYYPDTDLIKIDPRLDRSMYIHTLLHEAMHAFCCKYGIFKSYHEIDEYTASRKELDAWFRIAARAELYVDLWATKLFKRYDARLRVPVKTPEQVRAYFKKYKAEVLAKRGWS